MENDWKFMLLKIFNIYEIRARILPNIASIVASVCYFLYVKNLSISMLVNNLDLLFSFFSYFIIIYCTSRLVSSKCIERATYGKDNLNSPSVAYLMLHDKTFSSYKKEEIYQKIYEQTGYDIKNLTRKDTNDNRIMIKEAVDKIKDFVRKDEILFNHLVNYCGWRNFLGGIVINIVFVPIFAYIGHTCNAPFSSLLILTFVEFLCIFFGHYMMKFYADKYAERLYNAFLTT